MLGRSEAHRPEPHALYEGEPTSVRAGRSAHSGKPISGLTSLVSLGLKHVLAVIRKRYGIGCEAERLAK